LVDDVARWKSCPANEKAAANGIARSFFPSISLFLAYFFDSWRLGKKRLADCIANSEPKIAKRHDYTRKINDLTLVFLHLRLRSCQG
jgi:hypothetical protein